MNFLGKIIFLYILHCTAAMPAMHQIYHMSTKWNQSLLMTMKWIPQPINHELFYDILLSENNHSITALHWNPPVGLSPGGFNLTYYSHGFTGKITGSVMPCLIPVGKDVESLFPVKVVYLRFDRVLVYFKKMHKTKGPMQIPQIVDPTTCKIEDGVDMEPYVGFSPISIVPFKNTFDVIFYNQTLCPEDWWCKMTLGHDGNKVSEPTSLFKDAQSIMYVDAIYPMSYESRKEGHVVVTKKKDFPDKKSAVYSPVRGWLPAEDLKENNHFYTNTNGYASICWQTKDLKSIKCTRLDKSHADKNLNGSMTISLNDRTMQIPYIHHSPSGKIAMLKEGQEAGKKVVFSDTVTGDNKCKRYMATEFTNDLKRVELTVIDDDRSCTSLVTRDPNPVSQHVYSHIYAYEFVTKCVTFPKDFVAEEIACGKDYIFA